MKSIASRRFGVVAARIVSLIAALSMASGCSSLGSLERSLSSETSCCKSYKEFRFEPVVIDKESEFEIGPEGKTYAFVFPEGKSYFKALELPRLPDGYELFVATEVLGGMGYVPKSHSFYPKLVFLDETLTPVTIVEPALRFRMGFSRSFYEGKVLLAPIYRYLVIYTDPTRLRQKIFAFDSGYQSTTIPGTAGAPGVSVSSSGRTIYGNRGAGGTVKIAFQRRVRPK